MSAQQPLEVARLTLVLALHPESGNPDLTVTAETPEGDVPDLLTLLGMLSLGHDTVLRPEWTDEAEQ